MSKKNKNVVPQVDENGEEIVETTEKKENVFTKIGNGVSNAGHKIVEGVKANKTKIRNGLLITGIAVGTFFGVKELRAARQDDCVDCESCSDEMIDPDLITEDGAVPETENTEE